MSRKEFMDQLAYLLQDISEEERRDALNYYEGYFEEAGEDAEEQVTARLGSPQKVAAEIKNDLYGSGKYEENIAYTEEGCEDKRFREEIKSPQRYDRREKRYSEWGRGFHSWWDRQSNVMRVVYLGIFLAVFFSVADGLLNAVLGLAGGIFGLIGGLLGMIFGLFAGAFGITIAAYAAGAGMIGMGIVKIFTYPALGMLYCGIGCFGIVAGILLSFFCGWLCRKVIPAIIHGIRAVFRKIFRGRRGEA